MIRSWGVRLVLKFMVWLFLTSIFLMQCFIFLIYHSHNRIFNIIIETQIGICLIYEVSFLFDAGAFSNTGKNTLIFVEMP